MKDKIKKSKCHQTAHKVYELGKYEVIEVTIKEVHKKCMFRESRSRFSLEIQADHWPPGSQPLGRWAPATGLLVWVREGLNKSRRGYRPRWNSR